MIYLNLNSRAQNSRQTSWREKLASLRYIPALVKLVWQIKPLFTVAIVLLRLVRTLVPVGSLLVGKLIIDAVISAKSGNHNAAALWKFVFLEIGIVVGGQILARCSSLVEGLLGQLFSNQTGIRLMEHAATLDISHFENPAFYDQLERARRQTTNRLGPITQLLQICQDVLTLVSLSVALLVYSPWLVLLLAVAVMPSFFGESHFAILEYSLFHKRTPERRKLEYLLYVGASDKTAKEVQLFGLAGWLVSRYRTLADRFYRENKKLSVRKNVANTSLSLISVAAYYIAYAIILIRAVEGTISIGTLTFLAGSFERSNDLMQRLFLGVSAMFEQALYLKDLFEFFEMKPSIISRPEAPSIPRPIREGLVFEDVGFRYAESEKWAVRHVSFCIRPGERVALVGENGAGKTTLTKLLARLYDVTEGRILLDGRDIRDYDLLSLRRTIGVIFQDFVKYDLRFAENIGVGEIEKARSYLDSLEAELSSDDTIGKQDGSAREAVDPSVPALIISASDKSLASSLLTRLPDGYSQMLGRRFEGGAELSGGEWQKIALARAYMREAELLILDEPTASLDARAEYEVFERFSRLVAGRMAVIISHRFSTVRMADRIVVLKDGMLVEHGSHDQLVRGNGLYSELFSLQASGYR